MGDFLLVIIELFSLGAFVLSQYTRLTDRQTDRQTDVDGNTVRICFAYSRTVKCTVGLLFFKSMKLIMEFEILSRISHGNN